MSSFMYVCFSCRNSRRYSLDVVPAPKCQTCHQRMAYSYHKFEMPKKSDDKSWRGYHLKVTSFNSDTSRAVYARLTLRITALNRRLAALDPRNRLTHSKIEDEINAYRVELKRWHESRLHGGCLTNH